ncbi:maleylacetoacetate isomerase [Devosia nitrariae]|uniref:Maleylacetoacetate isomerase n=1 Tax=Devosia nitrariae TaxID=2071872 RepID=A0ABQ5W3W5_9HYPH|nr:maleylacetoacetate isomerase [Devosia nitrariae]GLQ54494.1 maleylacetoacetate isomerase [Devosia nitrariae]
MRLHTRYQNSAGERVRIVLELKSLAYDYVAIPSLSGADYRCINPQLLMPALEIDGHVVTQSLAIIELLEELYPDPSILPAAPFARAGARAFAAVIAADLHPVTVNRVRRYLAEELGAGDAVLAEWYRHWAKLALETLEALLKRRDHATRFAYSDTPGLAEACLVPAMRNARRFDCDLSPYPLLRELDGQCRDLVPFRRAAPESQPDFPA